MCDLDDDVYNICQVPILPIRTESLLFLFSVFSFPTSNWSFLFLRNAVIHSTQQCTCHLDTLDTLFLHHHHHQQVVTKEVVPFTSEIISGRDVEIPRAESTEVEVPVEFNPVPILIRNGMSCVPSLSPMPLTLNLTLNLNLNLNKQEASSFPFISVMD